MFKKIVAVCLGVILSCGMLCSCEDKEPKKEEIKIEIDYNKTKDKIKNYHSKQCNVDGCEGDNFIDESIIVSEDGSSLNVKFHFDAYDESLNQNNDFECDCYGEIINIIHEDSQFNDSVYEKIKKTAADEDDTYIPTYRDYVNGNISRRTEEAENKKVVEHVHEDKYSNVKWKKYENQLQGITFNNYLELFYEKKPQ